MTPPPARQRHLAKPRLAMVAGAVATVLGAALLWPGGAFFRLHDPVLDSFLPVTLADGTALYVGRTEVTLAEWAACHDDGGCSLALRMPGDGRDYPATGVSFVDAQEYIVWFNARTGGQFRLPSKAEWYALAAEVLPPTPDPIFTAPELRWASSYLVEAPNVDRALHPTGDFSTTSAGLRDLDGNVWEWTQDCYVGDASRGDPANCPAFIMGGLHQSVMFYLVRDPASGGCASGLPPAHLGFRLVTESQPGKA